MAYRTKYFPKNPTKYIGNINSINCRSLWERKFCKFLDFNESIIRWSFETLKIPYLSPIDNKVHTYYPDFIVEKKNKSGSVETLVVEIKPEKQTKKPVSKRKSKKTMIHENTVYAVNTTKWKAANEFCTKHEWKFVILTEKELFDGNS